jgi:hypothetical protein
MPRMRKSPFATWEQAEQQYAEHFHKEWNKRKCKGYEVILDLHNNSNAPAFVAAREQFNSIFYENVAPENEDVESTLSETIRQRPMRAGCWRFLHANDDKVTACGFRNDVRSRKVGFRPTVWLFREFSVRIINVNGHLGPIDFCSQPEPIFIPFKQLLPHRFPFTRS